MAVTGQAELLRREDDKMNVAFIFRISKPETRSEAPITPAYNDENIISEKCASGRPR